MCNIRACVEPAPPGSSLRWQSSFSVQLVAARTGPQASDAASAVCPRCGLRRADGDEDGPSMCLLDMSTFTSTQPDIICSCALRQSTAFQPAPDAVWLCGPIPCLPPARRQPPWKRQRSRTDRQRDKTHITLTALALWRTYRGG
jgi:hypothetical protein